MNGSYADFVTFVTCSENTFMASSDLVREKPSAPSSYIDECKNMIIDPAEQITGKPIKLICDMK